MTIFIVAIQIIESLINLWWKFLYSGKNPPHVSWLYTTVDTALFSIIGLYFHLYQLVAFELFFMLVAIGLFSKKLHKLHYAFIALIVLIVYFLNTINPVTTAELIAVFFFILAVYFWANDKRRLGWILIMPGHIFLIYTLLSTGAWIIAITQVISFIFAIRGVYNSKSLKNE